MKARVNEAGYANLTAYIIGLIRHDLMTRYEHKITAPIAKMPLDQQDQIDDWLAQCYEKGETLRSAWWDGALKRAAKEAAKDKDLPEDKIIRNLLNKLGENPE